MPFRAVLRLCASVGLVAAAAGQTASLPGQHSPPSLQILPQRPDLTLLDAPKQCSIPLKWANVQKSKSDPRSEKWVGPHPERVDPIYARAPAPTCTFDEETGIEKKQSAARPK